MYDICIMEVVSPGFVLNEYVKLASLPPSKDYVALGEILKT